MRAWPIVVAALLGSPGAQAALLDPNFTTSSVPGASLGYTSMAWAPDGSDRLFLTTKDGTTRIIENGVLLPTPFMTVTEIHTGSECGLLGIAFDPNFIENGYVYFFLTASPSEQRIVRYRAMGNVGVEPTTIVSGLPTFGANHDGGALGFGPDGKLYWAIGDLGNGTGVGDDLALLASKVGRVNRDGSVPSDNPFHDGGGPNDDRIWARGFRNPFTLAFQPSTGDLWLNVVGTSLEQVFIVGAGTHGGWSTHEYWQPDGFLQPVITYHTNSANTYNLVAADGAVRRNGVTTFTTQDRHWFHQGEQVTISGVSDPSFNGVAFVASTPSTTTFTIVQPGPDATSGAGGATTPRLGGCIAGGVFDDSTAASPDYRGNYYFVDFNSAFAMRARLGDGVIHSVAPFANGMAGAVDMSQGPDGDLYVATYTGSGPFRYRFQATSQYLVVSKTNVWMLEDGAAAFNVRLTTAPNGALDVDVRSPSGSTVSVVDGATLTFEPSNWSVPQVVTLDSVRDSNRVDDVVELLVSARGLSTEVVRVRVIDEYAPVEPPPDGDGGESGASGAGGEGGLGGSPGTGGTTGEAGMTSGGADGEAGAGGEGDTGATGEAKSSSDGGCGCAMRGHSGNGAALLVAALALLRRRVRSRPSGSRRLSPPKTSEAVE